MFSQKTNKKRICLHHVKEEIKRHRWKTTEDLENQIFNSMLKRHYRGKKVLNVNIMQSFNGVKYLQSKCNNTFFFAYTNKSKKQKCP